MNNGGNTTLAYWVVAVVVYLIVISQMGQSAAITFSALLVMGALIYNQRVHAARNDGTKTVFDTLSVN